MTTTDHVSLIGVCQRHHLPYQRAWRAVASGAVVAVWEGNQWRIPDSEVDNLVLACRDTGVEA